MAYPSVTYTFANNTAADATQVDQDFTDILNGITDGAHDINISAITCAGVATFNNNVTLGASSASQLTFTGSLSSSIPIKTNTTYDFGSSTLGLRSIYIGGGSTFTVRLLGPTLGASYTLTLPTGTGNSRDHIESDGSGVLSWVPTRRSGDDAQNLSLAASVSGNALTVTLKDAGGSSLSSTNPCDIVFRNATAATGTAITRTLTSNVSITLTSGSSLGHASGVNQYIYVYAVDNAGTVVLGLSSVQFDDGTLKSTTSEGGAGGATSNSALYTDNGVGGLTSKPIRLIGRMLSNQTAAGTWAAVPTEITTSPAKEQVVSVKYENSAGTQFGTAAVIPFATKITDTHNAWNTLSSIFTAPMAGIYLYTIRLDFASQAWSVNEFFEVQPRKNGTAAADYIERAQAATSHNWSTAFTDTIELAAGDTLDFLFTPGSANNPTLSNVTRRNIVTITRLGKNT